MGFVPFSLNYSSFQSFSVRKIDSLIKGKTQFAIHNWFLRETMLLKRGNVISDKEILGQVLEEGRSTVDSGTFKESSWLNQKI